MSFDRAPSRSREEQEYPMGLTRRRTPVFGGITLLTIVVSCAQSPVAPSRVAPPHAEISDPVGDAITDSRIAVSPDLASATVDVADGSITFVIQFAPGTVDRSTTWLRIELDTDQNAATGNRERNGMGSDYDLLMLANGNQAAIQKYDPVGCAGGGICNSTVGGVPLILSADTMRVTVPLLLGNNAEGHLFFLVKTWAVVGGASLAVHDAMPDDRLPPGRI
jgi:hypothetical protein